MSPTLIHLLTLSPQPITDSWLAVCSCGWRSSVSLYDIPEDKRLEAKDWTIGTLVSRHKLHVSATWVPDPRKGVPDP